MRNGRMKLIALYVTGEKEVEYIWLNYLVDSNIIDQKGCWEVITHVCRCATLAGTLATIEARAGAICGTWGRKTPRFTYKQGVCSILSG